MLLITIFTLLFTTFSSVSAQSSVSVSQELDNHFTKEQILTLEQYVSVNEDGLFELNDSRAILDGINEELINGQKRYFTYLNKQIAEGNLYVSSNLSTINESVTKTNSIFENTLSSCGGVTTDAEYHWWGVSRKLSSCLANKVSGDLFAVSSVSGGAAAVAAYFGGLPAIPPGITAAYFGLMAARISANNAYNTGVYVGITWAFVFDIEPQ